MRKGERDLAGAWERGSGPARAFVGLGSNIDPRRNVVRALEVLAEDPAIELTGISTIYLTRAVPPPAGPRSGGLQDEPDYLNGVLELHTTLDPERLYLRLLEVEKILGRARSQDKYAPRTMDLDLLLYLPSGREGGESHGPQGSARASAVEPEPFQGSTSGTLPPSVHPDVRTRPFVAVPLLELAPDLLLPPDGVPLRTVAASLHGDLGKPEAGLTWRLRARFLKG